MADKYPGRDEPSLFGGRKSAEDSGLRGERIDYESAEPARARRPKRKKKAPASASGPPASPRQIRRRLPRQRATRPVRAATMFLLRWAVTLAIWGIVVVAVVLGFYSLDLPDVNNLDALSRRPSIALLGADGQSFANYGDTYADVVPVAEMPPHLTEAVIATEDRRFFKHFGVDPIGLARAVFTDVRAGAMRQGGSTLTQQLAKNLFLSSERSVKRKVQELLLALWLEHKFSKTQILTIYLNRVYLGAGTFGVEAAAQKYFAKSVRKVTLYESAVLAGLLKAPARFNPAMNPDLTESRAAQVLENMVDAGYIKEAEAKDAIGHAKQALSPAAQAWTGRYYADWVMDQVKDLVGFIDRDLVVKTSYDAHLQRLAEETIQTTLDKEGGKVDASQGALVALKPDGEVLALVGGHDYRSSQFNRATQALRQPGSAFKPFVYLAGLEAGFTPDSVFDDAPTAIGKWHPNNYDGKYFGPVTLREALAHSLNSVAIQLAERAGVPRVIDVAHRLGITADLRRDASIALGTSEVTLLEMAGAFGAFANDGIGVWPYAVLEIRDRSGHVVYSRTGSGPGRVMTEGEAVTMVRMMQGVIDYGTGRAANLGRPAAGKTGTTQDYKDAWFIGFTPDLICGVWFGNDDGTPMKKVTGGKLPAATWHDFMTLALAGTPAKPFAAPPALENVVRSVTTPENGAPGKTAGGKIEIRELGPVQPVPATTPSGAVRAGR